MESEFQLFPIDASTVASRVDQLYIFLLAVTAFFVTLICFLILYFIVKYRQGSSAPRHGASHHNLWVELTWAGIPLVLVMIIFAWGAVVYIDMHEVPPDAAEIEVLGKQWMWKVQHRTGRREINTLHLPVNRPVRLRMISEDVIHSFFVPAFRSKMDVLPGRYTTLWFHPTRVGVYNLFCAEYCGTAHSEMIGYVIVQEPGDFAAWLGGEQSDPPELLGQRLFERYRCESCHSGRQDARCPPLAGIFGRQVVLADGRTVIADENYLRESILNPHAKVVAGYQPIMPIYEGQISEEEVLQLIAYLKTRGAAGTAAQQSADGNTSP